MADNIIALFLVSDNKQTIQDVAGVYGVAAWRRGMVAQRRKTTWNALGALYGTVLIQAQANGHGTLRHNVTNRCERVAPNRQCCRQMTN